MSIHFALQTQRKEKLLQVWYEENTLRLQELDRKIAMVLTNNFSSIISGRKKAYTAEGNNEKGGEQKQYRNFPVDK
uniref:Uncharacterized protein n=1 Tax=Sphaerodactylus townsendi TaxID=933632 RepID=A0ACB8F8G0_9SAUR